MIYQKYPDIKKAFSFNRGSRNYFIKGVALLVTPLTEVIYLDSDNIPLRNLDDLFKHPDYLKYGSIFWPDYWKTHSENPIYALIEENACNEEWEFETGQILFDKRKVWKPLLVMWYMNHYHDFYYKLFNGDKETFRFAWKLMGVKYFFVPSFLGSAGNIKNNRFCGHTMLQMSAYYPHHPLFAHANMAKKWTFDQNENVFEVAKVYKESNLEKDYEAIWWFPPGRDCLDLVGPRETEIKNFEEFSWSTFTNKLYLEKGGIKKAGHY